MAVINIPITNETDFKLAVQAINDYVNPVSRYNVALIGDSRLADNISGTYTWAGLLGRTDVISLAVPGEKAIDWLANSSSKIAQLKATGANIVIVQYGKNDVDAGKTASQIATSIGQIVNTIQSAISTANIYVLGILPVAASSPNSQYVNNIIDQTGTLIYNAVGATRWCQGYGGMKGNDNALIASYTDDGTHLNAAGRDIYKSILTSLI